MSGLKSWIMFPFFFFFFRARYIRIQLGPQAHATIRHERCAHTSLSPRTRLTVTPTGMGSYVNQLSCPSFLYVVLFFPGTLPWHLVCVSRVVKKTLDRAKDSYRVQLRREGDQACSVTRWTGHNPHVTRSGCFGRR